MNYSDRQVIVTGGTGALGTAVVGALVDAGAMDQIVLSRQRAELRELAVEAAERRALVAGDERAGAQAGRGVGALLVEQQPD